MEKESATSYRLAIEKKDGVLWVTATGTRSFEGVLAMMRDVMAALIENRVTRVLLDVRGLAGRLATIESYEIVDKYFPKIRDRNVVTRCGIVDLKEFQSSYEFFETVARNRGFDLRILSDVDEALEWLKHD